MDLLGEGEGRRIFHYKAEKHQRQCVSERKFVFHRKKGKTTAKDWTLHVLKAMNMGDLYHKMVGSNEVVKNN